MKLKKLTIHNVASIEDAVIDFEHGPLANDSRFLICGPTGSGKTTLLDSICLALFTTTPRLYETKKESFVDANEKYVLSQHRTDIKVTDTRMLMRRGTSDAFIELIFTDKDDKTLKSTWSCQRGKINGAINAPMWTLAEADDTVIANKKTEIETIIEERIGMKFEQFCRTTMLAQGDFTRFLKSDEGQKSEILEKLTGTDIYSDISKKIHDIMSEKEKACELIRSKLEGVTLLTEDERNVILQQQNDLKVKTGKISAEEQKLNAIISWMEQVHKLDQQYEAICKVYEEKHNLMLTDDFLRNSCMVDEWQRTALQREEWNKRLNASRLISEHKIYETELKTKYDYLRAGLLSLHIEEKQELEKKEKIESFLETEKTKAESYRQIDLIQSLVQQHKQASLQIKNSNDSIVSKNKDIEKLLTLKKQQMHNVGEFSADVDAKSKELSVMSQELQNMDYCRLLSQQKEKNNEVNTLKEYLELIRLYDQCHEILLQKEKELNAIHSDIILFKDEVEKAENEEKRIDEQLNIQQKIYDKQVLACKDVIKEYRSRLSVGDICPMCGQKIHAITSDEHFESVLKPVKECLEDLKKKYTDAGKLLSDKKAVLAQSLNTEKIRLSEYLKAEAEDRKMLFRKQKHVMFYEYKSSENPINDINERKSMAESCLKQIDEQLTTVGEIQNRVSLMQKEKEYLEKLLHKEENNLKETENRQTLLLNAVSIENDKIESLTGSISDIEEKMSLYISLDTYKSEGDSYILALKNASDKYNKATDMLQTLEKTLQQKASELRYIGELKAMIDEKHQDWNNIDVTEPVNINGISSRWMELQADVMKNDEAVRQNENIYTEADIHLQEYLKEENAVSEQELCNLAKRPASEIESVRRNLQNIKDGELSIKAEKNSVEQNMKVLKEGRPDFEDGLTTEKAYEYLQGRKDEIRDINQQLGQNIQILDNDEANKKRFSEITKKLDEANAELYQWSQLHELFGSHDGKKFRNIAQSYVLEQLLVSANQYLRQFTDRYEMECQPGSLLILLRDNDAGGVTRPTNTISGGESFLVSLSLALGLSSLSRASFSVDTLFIDEGFGTLDSTYLSCVMDALERLHQMGGKKIGIISHVESLKERITTQIQVSRVNNTLSKVEVVSLI